MDLHESSDYISIYDLFNKIEIEAYYCWYRFYSPNRDDIDWLDISIRLRLDDYSLKLKLYEEAVVAKTFETVFGMFSTEIDPIERGGDPGIYYMASFTEGKSYPIEEGRSCVKDADMESIRYCIIRKLRIEGLKILEQVGAVCGSGCCL